MAVKPKRPFAPKDDQTLASVAPEQVAEALRSIAISLSWIDHNLELIRERLEAEDRPVI